MFTFKHNIFPANAAVIICSQLYIFIDYTYKTALCTSKLRMLSLTRAPFNTPSDVEFYYHILQTFIETFMFCYKKQILSNIVKVHKHWPFWKGHALSEQYRLVRFAQKMNQNTPKTFCNKLLLAFKMKLWILLSLVEIGRVVLGEKIF